MLRLVCIFICSIFIILPVSSAWSAGSLYSPGDPLLGSGMCNLQELYDYLTKGAYPETPTVFREPETGPAPTMVTLAEILDEMGHLFGRCDVRPEHVLDTATFFSTDTNWGPQKGTIPKKALSADSTTMQAGYYDATSLTAIDADLTCHKIKEGTTIFGVYGTYRCRSCDSCCPGTATAGDVLTGTTFSSAAAGVNQPGGMPVGNDINATSASDPHWTNDEPDDTVTVEIPNGYYEGKTISIQDSNMVAGNIKAEVGAPVSIFGVKGGLYAGVTCNGTIVRNRWCVNGDTDQDSDYSEGDGTVTDLTTGLVWLQNANCSAELAGINKTGELEWYDAIVWGSVVKHGHCGLSDVSEEGDWRLPTKNELSTLPNGYEPVRFESPDPFVGVQNGLYWSSTTYAELPSTSMIVPLRYGSAYAANKSFTYYVLPVRGGK